MKPPRFLPPGVLQLLEVEKDGVKTVIYELPMGSRNRDRINQMRNNLLMEDPTRDLYVSENNSHK